MQTYSSSTLPKRLSSIMQFKWGFVSCLLVVLLVGVFSVKAVTEEDQHFTDFVQVAMRNYSKWLQENQLEPSPLIPNSVNMTYVGIYYNMTGEIWNQIIHNHSSVQTWEVRTDLSQTAFAVYVTMSEFQIIGEYQVKAYVGSPSYSGSGRCQLNATGASGYEPMTTTSFVNFTMTPEGYVNLTGSVGYEDFFSDFVGDFENLEGEGDAVDFVKTILANHVYKFYIHEWMPLNRYLQTFLQQAFTKATFADIISGRAVP